MARRRTQADAAADAPGDAALRGFTGYALKRAYMAIQSDFTATLAPFELRIATFSALMLIIDRPDMTQSQLAAALSIERSGVVLMIDELEGRDLITRNKVPTDRRTYALRATLAGLRLGEQAMAACRAHEARMLAGLDEEERARLHAMLAKIEAAAG
ncbi:MarR family winged helix-turn-helix transcriptional regulator [Rhodovulum sp. DZ06]|uniref:MarR family winged helix-turn-helix transcriptional regulator n=1 Tax=Rhodovulum sp. DZ06 TaxID=3425126 RepID=UPI003D34B1AB